MKAAVVALVLCSAMSAVAEQVVFDFHDPMSLTPSVTEPELKGAVNLNGMTFTNGNVSVAFEASGLGNTSVRLYNSYDAGMDLRLYDEDVMTVSVSGDSYISSIKFSMSLSGAASGSNDINFIPSTGEFVWEDEAWNPDEDTMPSSVELVSALQSRIYTMTVTTEAQSALTEVNSVDGTVMYYTIGGQRLKSKPTTPGLYISVCDGVSHKIIL